MGLTVLQVEQTRMARVRAGLRGRGLVIEPHGMIEADPPRGFGRAGVARDIEGNGWVGARRRCAGSLAHADDAAYKQRALRRSAQRPLALAGDNEGPVYTRRLQQTDSATKKE